MAVVGDAVRVVMHHVLIAVEGETVVKVAAEVMHGDDLVGRISLLDFASERTRGVVEIEQMAVQAEQEEHESD